MNYCAYFQALVRKPDTWFLVAVLRSHEHMTFDRTLDVDRGLFEFYVSSGRQEEFLDLMRYFIDAGIVSELMSLPNRLVNDTAVL